MLYTYVYSHAFTCHSMAYSVYMQVYNAIKDMHVSTYINMHKHMTLYACYSICKILKIEWS